MNKDSKFCSIFQETAICSIWRLIRSAALITSPCLSNSSVDTIIKHRKSSALSTIKIPLSPMKICSSLRLHGTALPFPTQISHTVWWSLAESVTFLLTYANRSISNLWVDFAKRQAQLLAASQLIGRIQVDEQRCWHRERINSLRPDPKSSSQVITFLLAVLFNPAKSITELENSNRPPQQAPGSLLSRHFPWVTWHLCQTRGVLGMTLGTWHDLAFNASHAAFLA